jgi:hypothetical protein
MWINSTIAKTKDDVKLLGKLDDGLYMLFYGVEGAGAGNDTTANSALSAVPFTVHVDSGNRDAVLVHLKDLGIIDATQELAIQGGSVGIVAVASLNNSNEGTPPGSGYNISLLAHEQLEILAKIAGKSGTSPSDASYPGIMARKVTVTLANRSINVIATAFAK